MFRSYSRDSNAKLPDKNKVILEGEGDARSIRKSKSLPVSSDRSKQYNSDDMMERKSTISARSSIDDGVVKQKKKKTGVWLFRAFLGVAIASLLGMTMVEIPATISVITGDSDSSTTLTLRASLSAEISSQQRRESWTPSTSLNEREMIKDCQHQAASLEKANINPTTTPADLDQLVTPFRKSHCGALWNNALVPSETDDESQSKQDDDHPINIQVVVSYCTNPLYWLLSDLEELKEEATRHNNRDVTVSVTIFSKCDEELKIFDYMKSAPFPVHSYALSSDSNAGGHHHTYAHWMAHYAQDAASEAASADYVFFLADDLHAPKRKQNEQLSGRKSHSLVEMLRTATQGGDGFACGSSISNGGLLLASSSSLKSPRLVSAHHCSDELSNYSFKSLPTSLSKTLSKRDRARFASEKFSNMGEFVQTILVAGNPSLSKTTTSSDEDDGSSINIPTRQNALWSMLRPSQDIDDKEKDDSTLIPVCYDDAFVVSLDHILNRNAISVYEAMETLLQRGRAWAPTEEGLYAERMWAGLFSSSSSPSSSSVQEALHQFGTQCRSNTSGSATDADDDTLYNYAGALERPVWNDHDEETKKALRLQDHNKKKPKQKMVTVDGAQYPEHVAAVILQIKAGKGTDIIGKDVSGNGDDERFTSATTSTERREDIDGGGSTNGVPNYILQAIRKRKKNN